MPEGFENLRLGQARQLAGIEEGNLNNLLSKVSSAMQGNKDNMADYSKIATDAFGEVQATAQENLKNEAAAAKKLVDFVLS